MSSIQLFPCSSDPVRHRVTPGALSLCVLRKKDTAAFRHFLREHPLDLLVGRSWLITAILLPGYLTLISLGLLSLCKTKGYFLFLKFIYF